MTPQQVIRLLSVLTLAANIGIGLFVTGMVIERFGLFKREFSKVKLFFSKGAILFSFISALIATSGSLYLSEVAGFTPCLLCWYQRIFMYPLTFILATALIRKTSDVWQYVLPLSILGVLIAAYHYYYQISGSSLLPCSTVGFSVPCSQRFFTYFGYITIPFMSLTAFILITIGMLFAKVSSKK